MLEQKRPYLVVLKIVSFRHLPDVVITLVGNPTLALLAYNYWSDRMHDDLVKPVVQRYFDVEFPDLVGEHLVILEIPDVEALRATIKPF